MRLDAIQQLRLEQKMRLAPRMIQSMEILQMTIAALEERIAQELEKNPVLELRESDGDTPEATATDEAVGAGDDSERELVIRDDNSNREDFERLDNLEKQFDPFEYGDHGPVRRRRSFDEEDPKQQALANTAAREISLHEYLMHQWDLVDVPADVRRCGEVIINYIEPDGYLKTTLDQLAETVEPPVPSSDVWETALAAVQKLDPPGVGAVTIQECLTLQLDALGDERELERQIVGTYFDAFQKQQFSKIAQKTGRSPEQVNEAVEFIRSRVVLHPGLTIGGAEVPFIVPDVIVDYDDSGPGLTVTVPDESSPSLHISSYYRRMLQDGKVDKQARQFIKNNIQSARWLIDAIEQRRGTLKKVTEAIVEAQTEFIENGPKFLRPLPMAQVADKVGVHLATVSRAVASKYVQTPRGIYPLRMFFSGGTETRDGESLSWDAVRAKIQEIIDAEDKHKPLSDDQIVAELKKDGIDLARRTVAKYRKVMGLPSSHRRKVS